MAGLLSGAPSECPCTPDSGRTKRSGSVPRARYRTISAPLAGAAAVKRHDLASRRGVGAVLRQLFGDPEQPFAALHLHPYVLGVDAGRNPEHDEVIDQV